MDLHNRRAFLRAAAAAGAAWSAADLLSVEDALAWSAGQAAAKASGGFTALSAGEAETIVALSSRIIPSVDKRPGAHEAGVVFFIDGRSRRSTPARRRLYAEGLQDLNRRAADMFKATAFSTLTAAQQDDVIRAIEKTPFFQARPVRHHRRYVRAADLGRQSRLCRLAHARPRTSAAIPAAVRRTTTPTRTGGS